MFILGSYLLSGGLEATLVTWQLETLTKDFTPRLGSPIQHLSVSEDDALAVISLSNNGKCFFLIFLFLHENLCLFTSRWIDNHQ